jgi:competence protein ComEC
MFPQAVGQIFCILPGLWLLHERLATHIIVCVLCAIWTLYRFDHYQCQSILTLSQGTVPITGRIIAVLKNDRFHTRFLFQIISKPEALRAKRLIISAFSNHADFHVGDVWRLRAKLRPLHTLKNPKHFDEALNFYFNGVHGSAYIQNDQYNQRLKRNTRRSMLFYFKQKVMSVIESVSRFAKDNDEIAILKALSIGDRHLSDKAWKVFQLTGTSHLMAISGLHISLIASIVYYSTRKLWSLFSCLMIHLPAFKAAAICSIVVTLLYGLLAGFSLPTQRAEIMTLVFMFEKLIDRTSPIYWRLLLALTVILIIQPLSIMTHSFWLSFIAVFCIVYFFNKESGKQAHRNWFNRILQWGKIQGIIFLGLLPISLFFFGQISLWCFIANSIAIPWICFVILPVVFIGLLCLSVSIAMSTYCFKFAVILLNPLWLFLTWLSSFDWAIWYHAITRAWVVVVAYLGVMCLLTRKLRQWRGVGFLAFIPLVFFASPVLNRHDFRLIMFDVGQGLSALIQTKYHLLIYDAGPKYVTGFDAASSIILPYLSYMHLNTIDELIISHGDIDHAGGADSLLRYRKIKDFITSNVDRFKRYMPRKCYQGQHWQWDGVKFEILWPPFALNKIGNNSSCVLKVSNRKRSILLTGDIESKTEQVLVKQRKTQLESTILIVPHHGSNTSSSEGFLTTVMPKYALFSTGYLNHFHFPAKKVWMRYKDLKIRRINTGTDGATQVDIKANGRINIHIEKKHHVF